jgi:hypothetical protein
MRPRYLLLALVVIVGSARPSGAQESGRVGLTMAFPAAVGVIWHATNALAIRPDFSFSQSGIDSIASSSNSTVTFGVSALFYLKKWDNLRAYLSPRFGYQRVSLTSTATSVVPVTNQYSGSGSFGAEYLLHPRFAVFAETGITYSHTNLDATTSIPGLALDSSLHNWATRAGVGAIFYF